MFIIVILLVLIIWIVHYQKSLTKKRDALLTSKRKRFEEHGKKVLPYLSQYDCSPCSTCGETTFSILNISPAGRSIRVKCEHCEEKTRFKSPPKADLGEVTDWWESTLRQKKELDNIAINEEHSVIFSLNTESPSSKTSSASRQIPKFDENYPMESDLDSEQFIFFQKLERDLDQGIHCDVDNNVGYLYVYLNKLLSSWDQIGLDVLRKKLIDISKLYCEEKAFSNYCLNTSLDCLLGQKKYAEYLKATEPTHVYILNCFAETRLNIQRILDFPANPIDLVHLTGGENRKTRFIIDNEDCYNKKLSEVFNEVEVSKGNWFEILKQWSPCLCLKVTMEDTLLEMAKENDWEVTITGESPEAGNPLWGHPISHPPMLDFEKENYSSGKCFENIRKLARDAENRAREEMGVPRIGEGWISETVLFRKLESAFPMAKVIQHGHPKWLGLQHFDIWIPKWNIAVEYHGKQHFEPVEFFGGEDAFKENVKRDERKSTLAQANGVKLFVVTENYDLDELLQDIRDTIVSN